MLGLFCCLERVEISRLKPYFVRGETGRRLSARVLWRLELRVRVMTADGADKSIHLLKRVYVSKR